MRSRAAFTLIEVLVVVLILGIAAAVVVPQMLRPGSLTIQAAARAIVSDIVAAQSEAVGRASSVKVVFDAAANTYKLTDAADAVLKANWKNTQTYETDFDTDRRFEGVKIDAVKFGSTNVLSFDEMGSPASGGTVDISAQGFAYRITVAPFTGRVTVAPLAAGG